MSANDSNPLCVPDCYKVPCYVVLTVAELNNMLRDALAQARAFRSQLENLNIKPGPLARHPAVFHSFVNKVRPDSDSLQVSSSNLQLQDR